MDIQTTVMAPYACRGRAYDVGNLCAIEICRLSSRLLISRVLGGEGSAVRCLVVHVLRPLFWPMHRLPKGDWLPAITK